MQAPCYAGVHPSQLTLNMSSASRQLGVCALDRPPATSRGDARTPNGIHQDPIKVITFSFRKGDTQVVVKRIHPKTRDIVSPNGKYGAPARLS